MVREQLKILSQLARIDNDVDERERKLIISIGKAHGVNKAEVEQIIANPGEIGDLSDIGEDEQFEYLLNVVQLMKIDGKVYNGELLFCAELASRLGYQPEVIMELYTHIYSSINTVVGKDELREKVKTYLKD